MGMWLKRSNNFKVSVACLKIKLTKKHERGKSFENREGSTSPWIGKFCKKIAHGSSKLSMVRRYEKKMCDGLKLIQTVEKCVLSVN